MHSIFLVAHGGYEVGEINNTLNPKLPENVHFHTVANDITMKTIMCRPTKSSVFLELTKLYFVKFLGFTKTVYTIGTYSSKKPNIISRICKIPLKRLFNDGSYVNRFTQPFLNSFVLDNSPEQKIFKRSGNKLYKNILFFFSKKGYVLCRRW